MARMDPGTYCPLIKKKCIKHECAWYIHVRGTDPNSGHEVDEYACSIAWQPMLLINVAQQARQGAAATESLRNKVVETAETALKTNIAIAGLLHGKPLPGLAGAPSLPDIESKEDA